MTSETIEEAIEDIYMLNSEYLVMLWNHVPVLISYKYDMSILITDVLLLLKTLRTKEAGQLSIVWPSNTFRTDWLLHWRENQLTIDTRWINVIGGTESLLNHVPKLMIDKQHFCNEWKKVLEILLHDIDEKILNENILGKNQLIEELNHLKKYGTMYDG